ncbi:MAG: recombinase RecA [Candidatus Abawacabacteria bacterium RBG_16_42_10]|uniref:Protein RecA n=1 Tax=Candidatus Abawacabacteria bacterium RBG_16_42_10 TaxID=1817814 RepID=A0A1F4XI68_9BACT|nr:MAG: recombinase RecA [Candidatus Abawacabacteria bacterium RBG_16_42_10]
MSNTEKNSQSNQSKEKKRAIELAMSQIEKQFGKGSIMTMSDVNRVNVEMISTGCLSLDIAMGGGMPKGRIIEIFGPESSGKTTLSLHVIAECQKGSGMAAFIDAEHAFDPEYAKKLGVDTENLLISQPDNGEQALDITETLVRSGAIDVIVIDSVAALVPKSEIEGEMGESHMGLQARLMSQALRKLTGIVSKSGTTIIFINQLRQKIGVMFGNPETTTGGNALKFYASVRIDVRKAEKIEIGTGDNREIIGNHTRVKIVKNKVAAPFRTAEFDILYNEGISKAGDIIEIGIKYNIIEKSGNFYSYGELKIGQGKENARLFLKQNPRLIDEISKKIKEALKKEKEEIKPAIPMITIDDMAITIEKVPTKSKNKA